MAPIVVNQIQWRPSTARATLPLVLIHDGSGLAFNYHLLDDLDRDVYGIGDPLFGTDRAWEGGIPEMAKAYAAAVLDRVTEGPILLGGWSLGGMIAIEMCRILQTRSKMKVSGLVLIDTPNSAQWGSLGPELADYTPDLSKSSPQVRQGVKRRFEKCSDLVKKWTFPSDADLTRPGAADPVNMDDFGCHLFDVEESASASGAALASFASDFDLNVDLRLQHQRGALPPTMLLRAIDAVPNPNADGGQFQVDFDRPSRLLGWEYNDLNFIRVVQDVPGHHYNLFEGDEKILALTNSIGTWCAMMDSIWIQTVPKVRPNLLVFF